MRAGTKASLVAFHMRQQKRVIIVGNSAAGLAAAESFRARDAHSKVLLIDREAGYAYSRVVTPYYIKGSLANERALFIRGENFYRELGIETILGSAVLGIDSRTRQVELEGGRREPFDLLLIATGAFPQRPRVEGADTQDIHVLRTLADARGLKSVKRFAGRGLFIGAGLVSLQTLEAMYKPGGCYTLVLKSSKLLSQTLDSTAAQIIERRLVKMGVRIVKGQDVVRIEEAGAAKLATLQNGEQVAADFVFMGKGVKPAVDWLQGSGVQIDQGILVDSHLRTSVAGIYAAGDCAQAPDFHSGRRISAGLWPAAVDQGEIAGRNMAGGCDSYAGNLKKNVSRIGGVSFASIGDFKSDRVAETLDFHDHGSDVYRKFCVDRSGILIGAVLVNRLEDIGVIHGLINGKKNAEYLGSRSSFLSYGAVYRESARRPLASPQGACTQGV